MSTTFRKTDEGALEITEVGIAPVTVSTYTYDDLVAQRSALENAKAAFCAIKDAEIARIDELISEADSLGVEPSALG